MDRVIQLAQDYKAAANGRSAEAALVALCTQIEKMLVPDAYPTDPTAQRMREFNNTTRRPASELSDADLVERVIRNMRMCPGYTRPRWGLVSFTFGLGSEYSKQLCRRFGLDPDAPLHGDGTRVGETDCAP